MSISISKYGVPTRLTSADAIVGVPGTVWAFTLEGGSATSSIDFTNDADGTGTPVYSYTVAANTSKHVCFEELGGIPFSSKIYGKLAGSGAVAYVWWSA